MQLVSDKWRQRAEQNPHHEADIEVKKSRDERWQMAALQKRFLIHVRNSLCVFWATGSCSDELALHRSVWRLFHAHGALLVVGLARDWIESALGDLVGVGFSEVKRQEDLSWSDDLRDSQLHFAHPAARGDHLDGIVRQQIELPRIFRIHFEPGTRRQMLQDGNGSGLGARVPVLHRAAGVENERKLGVRLLRKR